MDLTCFILPPSITCYQLSYNINFVNVSAEFTTAPFKINSAAQISNQVQL